jgi:hypothetical protein
MKSPTTALCVPKNSREALVPRFLTDPDAALRSPVRRPHHPAHRCLAAISESALRNVAIATAHSLPTRRRPMACGLLTALGWILLGRLARLAAARTARVLRIVA